MYLMFALLSCQLSIVNSLVVALFFVLFYSAWIELDFGKLCTIYSVTIQWWGISFAKEYTVLAAGEDGHYNAVKSEKDAYEGPKSDCDYNEWSKLTGWSVVTRKIKLVLRNGCLDPWGKQVWIGARQIVLKGMECS